MRAGRTLALVLPLATLLALAFSPLAGPVAAGVGATDASDGGGGGGAGSTGGLALSAADPVAEAGPGTVAVWELTVTNRGNASRTVAFQASSGGPLRGAVFEPDRVALAAGASAAVRLSFPIPDSGGTIQSVGTDFGVQVNATDVDDPTVRAGQALTLRLTTPDLAFRLLPSGTMALIALAILPVALGYGFAKDMSPTLVIAATILGLFFLQLFSSAAALGGAMDPVMRELSLRPVHFVQGWQWWAPVSHMFMHGGLTHIIGNLIILVLVGPRLEMHMSNRTYTVLYFLSGLGAALATVVLFFDEAPLGLVPNVGASGAIYGVLAAFAMRLPKERIPIPFGILIFIPAYIAFPLYVAYNIFLSFGGTNVAWWAHLAGAAVGAVFAYFWRPKEPVSADWQADWQPGW